MRYKGGCLCGAVRYEINGPINNIVCCHCSKCRKAQGGAFATNGFVFKQDFTFLKGEASLRGYESSPGQTKYFCSCCGSPIISKNLKRPDQLRIRLGTIDSEIDERPEAHIFVGSKACWEDVGGDLPQYETYESTRD
ncbi:GFA family protein [Pseudomonadota bacterium]